MKFEDAYNYVSAAIGIGMALHECHKIYKEVQDRKAREAADNWEREAGARLNALLNHAVKNRISKQGYVEALTAAKNVLAFEVNEALPGNVHGGEALRGLHAKIDKIIADV